MRPDSEATRVLDENSRQIRLPAQAAKFARGEDVESGLLVGISRALPTVFAERKVIVHPISNAFPAFSYASPQQLTGGDASIPPVQISAKKSEDFPRNGQLLPCGARGFFRPAKVS
jgi:hypothetical protein